MKTHPTDRLSDYLDGELGDAERRELEAHLEGCAECAATLEELRAVVARAHALEDRPPDSDLWPGIAARIEAGRPTGGSAVEDIERARAARTGGGLAKRRFSFSVPQLAAAGVALMLLSSGTAWMLLGGPDGQGVTEATNGAAVSADVPAATFASTEYHVAIAELERELAANRSRLDTATVRIIEENLRKIDLAISDARRALAEDPASTYLNDYLASTMRQKLEFLQRAAAMASASS